jgi:hypothetical protein
VTWVEILLRSSVASLLVGVACGRTVAGPWIAGLSVLLPVLLLGPGPPVIIVLVDLCRPSAYTDASTAGASEVPEDRAKQMTETSCRRQGSIILRFEFRAAAERPHATFA